MASARDTLTRSGKTSVTSIQDSVRKTVDSGKQSVGSIQATVRKRVDSATSKRKVRGSESQVCFCLDNSFANYFNNCNDQQLHLGNIILFNM